MFKRWKFQKVAALADGEMRHAADEASCRKDEECRVYLAAVRQLHHHAQAVPAPPEISDGQFGAFMAGIREGLEAPAPRRSRAWALASAAAAALILVVSLLVLFSGGPEKVRANKVESVSTELDGVTVDTYDSRQGVSTVWVTMPESDLW